MRPRGALNNCKTHHHHPTCQQAPESADHGLEPQGLTNINPMLLCPLPPVQYPNGVIQGNFHRRT